MPALIPLDNTWGAVLIGVFFGIFLYGILTLQAFSYFQRFPRDSGYLKATVGSIWVLDTFHTMLITHMIYTYLVTDFGDYLALQKNTWSFNLHVLTTSIVACISQVYFIHRCWKLDKSKFNTFVSGFILLIALTQLGLGITCTAYTFKLTEYVQFLKYTPTVDAWLGSAALCDILVSAAIVRSLWSSRTGLPRTNNLVMKLILWTVNTGIVTSVWAILDIALFTASKDTLIHDFFNVTLAKLYANTLLATLNNRRSSEDNLNDSQNIYVSGGRHIAMNSKPSGVHITSHTVQDIPPNTPDRSFENAPTLVGADVKKADWVHDGKTSLAIPAGWN